MNFILKYCLLFLIIAFLAAQTGCSNKSYPCPDNSGDVQVSTSRGNGVGKLKGKKSSTDKDGLLKKRKKYGHGGMK